LVAHLEVPTSLRIFAKFAASEPLVLRFARTWKEVTRQFSILLLEIIWGSAWTEIFWLAHILGQVL